MAKIGYRRTSTTHQKGGLERQSYALPKDLDKVFTDEASGKDTNRPEFQKMMDQKGFIIDLALKEFAGLHWISFLDQSMIFFHIIVKSTMN